MEGSVSYGCYTYTYSDMVGTVISSRQRKPGFYFFFLFGTVERLSNEKPDEKRFLKGGSTVDDSALKSAPDARVKGLSFFFG